MKEDLTAKSARLANPFAVALCTTAAFIAVLLLGAVPALAQPIVVAVSGCSDSGSATEDCPTVGGVSIAIVGSGLTAAGETTTVSIGSSDCPVTDASSETSIQCTLPPGTGLNQGVVVTVGVAISASAPLVNYAAPSIIAVSGCSGGDATGCLRAGGDTITVTGNNFGASGATVLVGASSCTGVAHDLSTPHGQVTCSVPAGTGSGKPVQLIQSGGTASANAGSLSYVPCPPGTFISGIECTACDAGTYSDTEDAFSCANCVRGTAQPNTGSESCEDCLAGTFASSNGSTTCLDCLVGTFQAASGQSTCTSCGPGTYSDSPGSSECTDCALGFFQDQLGQATCNACAPGSIAAGVGATGCDLCLPGTFNRKQGQSECEPCGIGSVQSNTGTTECNACAIDEIAEDRGMQVCEACPLDSSSPEPGGSVCLCDPGFYHPSADSGSAVPCVKCPVGAICDQPGTTFEEITTEEGYWRAPGDSLTIYRCLIAAHCSGDFSTPRTARAGGDEYNPSGGVVLHPETVEVSTNWSDGGARYIGVAGPSLVAEMPIETVLYAGPEDRAVRSQPEDVIVLKDGVEVPLCTDGAERIAEPDPCEYRRDLVDDTVEVGVYHSQAGVFEVVAEGTCTHVAMSGCAAADPSRSKLIIKDNTDDAKDKMVLKISVAGGDSTVLLGTPGTTTAFAVCGYSVGALPSHDFEASLAAGGTCGKKPCWKGLPPDPVLYKDTENLADGLRILKAVETRKGELKIKALAKGANLALDTSRFAAEIPVVMQLQTSDGTCIEAILDDVKVK